VNAKEQSIPSSRKEIAMLHSARPALVASTLAPHTLTLFADEQPTTICPDCGAWQPLYRHMIAAHRDAGGKDRCPGSAQLVELDLEAGEWLARLQQGRPVLRASKIPPNMISLHAGERPSAVCPDCRRWRLLHQGAICPHRADDGHAPCPGSGQRILLDLTAEVWQARRAEAVRQAGTRRSNRTPRRASRGAGKRTWAAAGAPPVPIPVHRLGRRPAA
jgi:hypothetical protein